MISIPPFFPCYLEEKKEDKKKEGFFKKTCHHCSKEFTVYYAVIDEKWPEEKDQTCLDCFMSVNK